MWVEGRLHLVYKDGKVHYNLQDASGTGWPSGRSYTVGGAQNESYDFDGAGHYIYSFHIMMTSEDGCSFMIIYKVHYHFNANGDLVVDNITYEFRCDE